MITLAYGARAPTEGLPLLIEQLRLASRYRNNLIELEIYRRAALDFGADSAEVRAAYSADSRAIRKASGLGWGTYQLIEDDVQRAKRTSTPRFRRHDGTGRVGAPVQACSRLTETLGPSVNISKPDRRGHALARMRLTEGGWITLPVKLHRPIPPGRVVRVLVTVDRIGTRWVYGLRVVSHAERRNPVSGNGKVSINFGWRVVDDGVCVATAVGDHGMHELILPSCLLEKYRHSEGLRSLADLQASQHIGDPRRRTRMRRAGLAHPIPRDSHELRKLHLTPESSQHHWALRDRHLYQWERNEYRRAIRQRKALTLAWVQDLARRYDKVTVETYSLAALLRRGASELPEARHIRFLVAPGELRATCASVFGAGLTKLPRKRRTMVCATCGEELVGDRVRSKVLTCERCDAQVDQDVNNAENQHAIAAE